MPESWDTLFVSLSNFAPDGKLTMDSVIASVLNEETRRKKMGSSNRSEAHYVAQESNRGREFELLEVGTIPKTCLNPKIDLFVITAKTNHIKRFCRKMKRDKSKERKGNSSKSKSEEKNTTVLEIRDDHLLFIGDKDA